MSRNTIVILLLSLSLSFFTLHAKDMPLSEDELIIRGIFYDEYHLYKNSYKVYKKLFDETQAEVYLLKEATSALLAQEYIVQSISRLKDWTRRHNDTIEVQRLLIPLYLTARQVNNAQIEAELLLKDSQEVLDFDLASNAFLYAGNVTEALDLLHKIYKKMPQESVLLRIAEIMDEFIGERIKAIQLLEMHRRMHTVSSPLYEKLLLLYQKEKDIEGIFSMYKMMYAQDKQEEYLHQIIDVYVYKHHMKGAIDFLEKDKIKSELLYQLYKIEKEFVKAISLADTLYNIDKNAKWIAEKGVLIFENAKDKNDKKMIDDVLMYLEKSILLGNDDSIYLNYYGYTLIDKEINIPKGMKIIQDALIQQPDNTYYLDSLAWGYYKEGNCQKAYNLMKRVVAEEGLVEEEIKEHWSAIRDCQ
ncbi:MAG: hypothetical protein Q9M36_09025 [Sulfurovum sp.]|nr:hypothetical protein [Sulfurovum sp.]